MNRAIISTILTLKIHLQRVKDHSWRNLTGMPRVKRSLILPNLYLGGQYGLKALSSFHKWGITAVVNMRMHSIHKDVSSTTLRILNLPTPDFYAPTQKQLERGVFFITEELAKGGSVYIHCRQGEGRGPTMAIAYLMSTGLTLEHALQLVKKVRTFINPTQHQLIALQRFETYLLEEES